MDLPEARTILRGYQRWRRGEDERTMDEAGIVPLQVGLAIDVMLAATEKMPRLENDLTSAKRQLVKCFKDRKKIHLDLQRLTAKTSSTDH